MRGAPRKPAHRNHFLVRIVKPSGCHCTDALGGTKYRGMPTPLRSTSPFSDLWMSRGPVAAATGQPRGIEKVEGRFGLPQISSLDAKCLRPFGSCSFNNSTVPARIYQTLTYLHTFKSEKKAHKSQVSSLGTSLVPSQAPTLTLGCQGCARKDGPELLLDGSSARSVHLDSEP